MKTFFRGEVINHKKFERGDFLLVTYKNENRWALGVEPSKEDGQALILLLPQRHEDGAVLDYVEGPMLRFDDVTLVPSLELDALSFGRPDEMASLFGANGLTLKCTDKTTFASSAMVNVGTGERNAATEDKSVCSLVGDSDVWRGRKRQEARANAISVPARLTR